MTPLSVVQEFKTEMRRLAEERDILRDLLADEIQGRLRCPREEAEMMINREIFDRLRSGRRA